MLLLKKWECCRGNLLIKGTLVYIKTIVIFIRYKSMMSYKLDALQKQLSESVPVSQLEAANRQYADLTASYRDYLQREQLHSVREKK